MLCCSERVHHDFVAYAPSVFVQCTSQRPSLSRLEVHGPCQSFTWDIIVVLPTVHSASYCLSTLFIFTGFGPYRRFAEKSMHQSNNNSIRLHHWYICSSCVSVMWSLKAECSGQGSLQWSRVKGTTCSPRINHAGTSSVDGMLTRSSQTWNRSYIGYVLLSLKECMEGMPGRHSIRKYTQTKFLSSTNIVFFFSCNVPRHKSSLLILDELMPQARLSWNKHITFFSRSCNASYRSYIDSSSLIAVLLRSIMLCNSTTACWTNLLKNESSLTLNVDVLRNACGLHKLRGMSSLWVWWGFR